ncbi:hypothetical protein Ddc_18917 [Ditylenchus destructor]|nr:hypothetical protein Ddc_18917 [Ditylenchus destructor]
MSCVLSLMGRRHKSGVVLVVSMLRFHVLLIGIVIGLLIAFTFIPAGVSRHKSKKIATRLEEYSHRKNAHGNHHHDPHDENEVEVNGPAAPMHFHANSTHAHNGCNIVYHLIIALSY